MSKGKKQKRKYLVDAVKGAPSADVPFPKNVNFPFLGQSVIRLQV